MAVSRQSRPRAIKPIVAGVAKINEILVAISRTLEAKFQNRSAIVWASALESMR
jgi:hypothetical protein